MFDIWRLFSTCADPESFSEGVQHWQRFFSLFSFFSVDGMERGSKCHYKWSIIGMPAKRHWNGGSLACRYCPTIECWLGSLVIFRGSRSILLGNSIFLWCFRGEGPDPPAPPPPWIRPFASNTFYRFYFWGRGMIAPECQTAWVRTVCKDHQLMTKFTASRERVNLCVYIHTSTEEGVLYRQWRLWWNAEWCGISSGSSLFVKDGSSWSFLQYYLD